MIVPHNRNQNRVRAAAAAARLGYQIYRTLPPTASVMSAFRGSGRAPSAQVVRMSHEVKNLPTIVSGATVSIATYNPQLVNNITQGSGAANRTGRAVLNESLRIAFQYVVANTIAYDGYRVMVVYDRESRGAAPGLADILTSSGIGNSLISSYFQDNVNRFRILFDKQELVHNEMVLAGPSYTGGVRSWVTNIKLPQRTHFFNTSAGTIADIDSGSIYVMVMGLSTAAGATYTLDCQLFFRDV